MIKLDCLEKNVAPHDKLFQIILYEMKKNYYLDGMSKT